MTLYTRDLVYMQRHAGFLPSTLAYWARRSETNMVRTASQGRVMEASLSMDAKLLTLHLRCQLCRVVLH